MFSLGMIKRQRKRIYARGGLESEVGGFRYHIFTGTGALQVFVGGNMQVTLVGGGGGGGAMWGGGGGAGGVVHIPQCPVMPGIHNLVVGRGGKGSSGSPASPDVAVLPRIGDDTTGFGFIAKGGGAGGTGATNPGFDIILTSTWAGYNLSLNLATGGSGGGAHIGTSTVYRPYNGHPYGKYGTSTQYQYSHFSTTATVYAIGNRGESQSVPHAPTEGGSYPELGGGGGGAGRRPTYWQPYFPALSNFPISDGRFKEADLAGIGGPGLAIPWGSIPANTTTITVSHILLGGGGGGSNSWHMRDGSTNRAQLQTSYGGGHGGRGTGWVVGVYPQQGRNGSGGGGGAGAYGWDQNSGGARGGDGIILIKYAQSSRTGTQVEPPLGEGTEFMLVGGGGGGSNWAFDLSTPHSGAGGGMVTSEFWPVLGGIYTATFGAGGWGSGWSSMGYPGTSSTFRGPDQRGHTFNIPAWGGGGAQNNTGPYLHVGGGAVADIPGGFLPGSRHGASAWGPSSAPMNPAVPIQIGGQGNRFYSGGGYAKDQPYNYIYRDDFRYGTGNGGPGGYGWNAPGKPGSLVIKLPEKYTVSSVTGLNWDVTYYDGYFSYNFMLGGGNFQIADQLFDTTNKLLVEYCLVGGGGAGGGTGGGGAGGFIQSGFWASTGTLYSLGVGEGGIAGGGFLSDGTGSYISGTNVLYQNGAAIGGGGGGANNTNGRPGASGGGAGVTSSSRGDGIIPRGHPGGATDNTNPGGGGGARGPGSGYYPGYGTQTNFITTAGLIWVCGGGNPSNNSTDYSAQGAYGRPGVVVPPSRGMGGGANTNGGSGFVSITIPTTHYIQYGQGLTSVSITTMTNFVNYTFYKGFDGILFLKK